MISSMGTDRAFHAGRTFEEWLRSFLSKDEAVRARAPHAAFEIFTTVPAWFFADDLPEHVAFDHVEIVREALLRLGCL